MGGKFLQSFISVQFDTLTGLFSVTQVLDDPETASANQHVLLLNKLLLWLELTLCVPNDNAVFISADDGCHLLASEVVVEFDLSWGSSNGWKPLIGIWVLLCATVGNWTRLFHFWRWSTYPISCWVKLDPLFFGSHEIIIVLLEELTVYLITIAISCLFTVGFNSKKHLELTLFEVNFTTVMLKIGHLGLE